MERRKRAPRRGEGHPRVTLDEATCHWRGPRWRHVEKHAGQYLKAFYWHLMDLRPDCLQAWADAFALSIQVRTELESLNLLPFRDPAEWPATSPRPTADAPGEAPNIGHPPPADHDPAEALPEPAPGGGPAWRLSLIRMGRAIAVEHRGATLHFGEHVHHIVNMAFNEHVTAWFDQWADRGMDPRDYVTADDVNDAASREMQADVAAVARWQAEEYVAANPGARIVGPPPSEPGMYDGWPPAQPRMDDGSHLLASERGRRRINPETRRRMIRTMVLTDDAWPHWEWSEDVEGAAGVGPWGPGVSFGTPEEPAQMSQRESMRRHLTRIGRLDLLHKYLSWEGDTPL